MQEKEELSKLSKQGQLVIPSAIRKQLHLEGGDIFTWTINDKSEMVLKKKELDWSQILKRTPEEEITFDKNGNYDAKKHPDFHDWMTNS
ncbi:AbrB/MazE/SpoVT family DNA-binding domain-containing protein [Companilactobacillus futsaii]|uniref:AbrB family transcriptional regulator n=2 Tax=Companilactobacillus futsaii TaxID=938155 RepID=A0A5B7SXY9_9LACO|nr:AbrB/MazE/SpoVT family DNA-binding domain-containing protein [Companilactobacillus futsaii]KRK91880.1 hypothetical protein FC88_GL001006 [Companilactobacillus futsaii JCM 17355]QCX24766.1 AbrB family transcriptional regulator [Companilactobacillus futsaii]